MRVFRLGFAAIGLVSLVDDVQNLKSNIAVLVDVWQSMIEFLSGFLFGWTERLRTDVLNIEPIGIEIFGSEVEIFGFTVSDAEAHALASVVILGSAFSRAHSRYLDDSYGGPLGNLAAWQMTTLVNLYLPISFGMILFSAVPAIVLGLVYSFWWVGSLLDLTWEGEENETATARQLFVELGQVLLIALGFVVLDLMLFSTGF